MRIPSRRIPMPLNWLFKAGFGLADAAPIASPQLCDKGSLTVTDTGNHLSVSGGQLVCDGGEVPAWGDPGAWSVDSFARVAGRALLGRLTITDATSLCEFGFDANQAGALGAQGLRCNADVLYATIGGTVNPAVYVPLDGTAYDLCVVLLATGSVLLLKLATANVWTVLYRPATGTTTPVYGAVPNNSAAWNLDNLRVIDLGGAWASDYGIARAYVPTPAAITPTLGGEIIADGDMEAVGVANWAQYNTPTTREKSEVQEHGGSQSVHIIGDATADGAWQGGKASVVGTWYQYLGWAYVTAGTLKMSFRGTADMAAKNFTAASWGQLVGTNRCDKTDTDVIAQTQGGAGEFYIDDISVKPITLSTTLGTVYDKHADYLAEVSPTLTAGTQAGLMLNIDDDSNPANFILAYHNGTNACLDKCVAGTYTSLISTAATYSAGKRLVVIKDGTSVTLYYNDVKIGATQTVTDAGIKDNTKHSWWSTYASNSFSNFVIWPRTVTLPTGV